MSNFGGSSFNQENLRGSNRDFKILGGFQFFNTLCMRYLNNPSTTTELIYSRSHIRLQHLFHLDWVTNLPPRHSCQCKPGYLGSGTGSLRTAQTLAKAGARTRWTVLTLEVCPELIFIPGTRPEEQVWQGLLPVCRLLHWGGLRGRQSSPTILEVTPSYLIHLVTLSIQSR